MPRALRSVPLCRFCAIRLKSRSGCRYFPTQKPENTLSSSASST